MVRAISSMMEQPQVLQLLTTRDNVVGDNSSLFYTVFRKKLTKTMLNTIVNTYHVSLKFQVSLAV